MSQLLNGVLCQNLPSCPSVGSYQDGWLATIHATMVAGLEPTELDWASRRLRCGGGVFGIGHLGRHWGSATNYAVLFSGLQQEDAAAITQKLDSDRIPFQLSAGGTTILVPSERVLKVRMNLALAGLPQGAGKGFELFDQMSIGATPFVQNLSYVRAIQGELARTIMQLEPVANARVHIVQPDPTPFVREEKPVTASVVIRTKSGQTLTRGATAGIVALVSGSVKGLTSDNVTVLDTEGRVLSDRRDSKSAIVSADQREYQREIEADLATKAQEILTRLLGPGQAVVRVTAEMSFRRVKEQSEKFDPDARVANGRIHQVVEEYALRPAPAAQPEQSPTFRTANLRHRLRPFLSIKTRRTKANMRSLAYSGSQKNSKERLIGSRLR